MKLDFDASSVGLGAVLSNIDNNNHEKPIEFISRTLTPAERKYSQIEKEALAIVWAVSRFHRYLYARSFLLVTDHKPLEFLFNPNKNIPLMGISRIQRWALILSSYQYDYSNGSAAWIDVSGVKSAGVPGRDGGGEGE